MTLFTYIFCGISVAIFIRVKHSIHHPNIICKFQPQVAKIYLRHHLRRGGGGGGGGGGGALPPMPGAAGGGGAIPPANDVEAMLPLGSNIDREGGGRLPGGMSDAREQELSFPGEPFLCLKRAILSGSFRSFLAGGSVPRRGSFSTSLLSKRSLKRRSCFDFFKYFLKGGKNICSLNLINQGM